MRKIITILQPFDLNQQIFVYENGQKIDAQKIETLSIPQGVCGLARQYEIKDIELGGPKQYARGIGKKITEYAISEYGINDLEIKIL